MKKKITATIIAAVAILGLGACGTQAERAAHNSKVAAENFQVLRRLAVINTESDQIHMEMVGYLSIKVDSTDSQLEITAKQEDGTIKHHYVGIGPHVTYVLEDISGADVSSYRYQISFLPEAIVPVEIVRGS